MKTLLVNPNTYRNPPVPPLALEHLEAALDSAGHASRILDLTFEPEPEAALGRAIRDFGPAVAGLTVRNVDTCIYRGNEFFLDRMKPLVAAIRAAGIPAVLGGAGFSAYGEPVLDYLGADYGVSGPGERALPALLDLLAEGRPPAARVLDGWRYGFDPSLRLNGRGRNLDYAAYLAQGALAGFETQKGCLGACPFCPEATPRLLHREPAAVVEELAALVEKGIRDFHLCDTEFNQDLRFCHAFLEAMVAARLSIRWALYLKAAPFDRRLFELLAASGAWLITLSLPSGGQSWLDNAAQIAGLCRDNGIRLAVDFLCGFPGDSPDSIRRDLDTLRAAAPDTVGLNSVIRLIPGCPTTHEVLADPGARPYLRGPLADNPGLVRPVFYHRIGPEELKEIVGGDPLFRVEGFESGSNYQRV